MCTLSSGLVLCMPCLSCQSTQCCGSKFWNYDTLFKIQEMWLQTTIEQWTSVTFSQNKSTATWAFLNSKRVVNFKVLYQTIAFAHCYHCWFHLCTYHRWGNFTGLNFCIFNPTKVFTEILSSFLSQKCLLLKRGTYIHGKILVMLMKTTKTMKV